MNKRSINLIAKLSIAAWCLAGLLVADFVQGQQPAASPSSVEAGISPMADNTQQEVVDLKKQPEKDVNSISHDPFRSHLPQGSKGFIPSQASIPPGIKVLAIMIVEGAEPLAVLEVSGMVDVVYVHPGDVISIDNRTTNRSSHIGSKNSNITNRVDSGMLYVQIENITSQQVELYPRDNPSGKQILQ